MLILLLEVFKTFGLLDEDAAMLAMAAAAAANMLPLLPFAELLLAVGKSGLFEVAELLFALQLPENGDRLIPRID